MHEGDTADTILSATAATMAYAATADAAFAHMGDGRSRLATDVATDVAAAAVGAAIAPVAAADAAVARRGVGAATSSTAAGAQPITATNGTGTSFNDCVGPTGSVARCPIGCGSVCTIGGTANSRTGSGTHPRSVGPTGIVATRGIVCNFS